jgi:hypothetical protein
MDWHPVAEEFRRPVLLTGWCGWLALAERHDFRVPAVRFSLF